jgi:hypothetical protein
MARKVIRIEVWWDDQVPGDHGWAWSAYDSEDREDDPCASGALPSRRHGTSDRRLATLARREVGVTGDRSVTVEICR